MITVAVEEYTGHRDALRWSFELAEDSESELLSYLYRGRVLVARIDGQVAGHLLLVDVDGDTATPREAELKSMAVRADLQGRGTRPPCRSSSWVSGWGTTARGCATATCSTASPRRSPCSPPPPSAPAGSSWAPR